MRLDYKLLGIFAIAILAIYATGATGMFGLMTVVSGDTEISLPSIIRYSNVADGYNAVTDTYTGGMTSDGAWTFAKFSPGEDGFIEYSNVNDPFTQTNREDGKLKLQIAYADTYSAEGAGVIYVQMMRDSGGEDTYFVSLVDYDGSSHVKTLTMNEPLAYYDTSGNGVIKFKILHRAADGNYINIYGARLIMSLAPTVDTCQISDCDLDCVGTTKYTNPRCVDGACKYTKTANSPSCGYDACSNVDCEDSCEGTTLLYGSTCSNGACTPPQRLINSATCGYETPDAECPSYCDEGAHTNYYNGKYVNGACEYTHELNSVACGFVVDPVDPTDPQDDDEMLLIATLIGGTIVILSLIFVGLRLQK